VNINKQKKKKQSSFGYLEGIGQKSAYSSFKALLDTGSLNGIS
jgi:hypothetical protein